MAVKTYMSLALEYSVKYRDGDTPPSAPSTLPRMPEIILVNNTALDKVVLEQGKVS